LNTSDVISQVIIATPVLAAKRRKKGFEQRGNEGCEEELLEKGRAGSQLAIHLSPLSAGISDPNKEKETLGLCVFVVQPGF
jgi:hypothetical protein